MNNQYELTEQSVQPALSIRTRTSLQKLPQEIGQAYGAIMQYLAELGVAATDAPFTAYYNLDMADLDVEMGFPVAQLLPGKGDIKASEIPAGKRVSTMYKGPYSQMESVYTDMLQWISEQGLAPTGVAYEYYYNSPADVPESELLTRIVFPVQ